MPGPHLVRLGPPAKGDTIHRSTCRYAKRPNALRWVWADLENIDWDALRRHGLKSCGVCAPEILSPAATPRFEASTNREETNDG